MGIKKTKESKKTKVIKSEKNNILKEENKSLKSDVENLKNKNLRALADFENLKKRKNDEISYDFLEKGLLKI